MDDEKLLIILILRLYALVQVVVGSGLRVDFGDVQLISWPDGICPKEVEACKYTCDGKSSKMKI